MTEECPHKDVTWRWGGLGVCNDCQEEIDLWSPEERGEYRNMYE